MHDHLGRGGLALEAGRQRRHRRSSLEDALLGVVLQERHRAAHLVDDISVFAIGMKGEMAWTCPGSHGNVRRVIGRDGALGWVEAVDENLIEAQVGHEGEMIGRGPG